MIPFSVLDLAPIVEGSDPRRALQQSLDLAQHAEQWGYHRYWLAEHHGMPGIASAATSVVIGYVANGTRRIRVGAGGIMLPNHSPLVIAEQFGTLEALFPGRIDLALGRAPGSDQQTAYALRRRSLADPEAFPSDVVELMAYFRGDGTTPVRAVPGGGASVPLWILGSSLFGAEVAATLGLPYAFASHFAPAQMMDALDTYRRHFRPSVHLQQPRVMLGFNVIAADTDEAARYLFTSLQQAFVNLRRGAPGRLPPPVDDVETQLNSAERAMLDHALACRAVGSPQTVAHAIQTFVDRTAADELILTSQIYDHRARLHSYQIVAGVRESITASRAEMPAGRD